MRTFRHISIKLIASALLCLLLPAAHALAQEAADPPRVVHVFVALCDNENQGIVPVPKELGNGEDPARNLYWGALYGVKSFFKRSRRWALVSCRKNPSEPVLERCVFYNKDKNVYLVADAYQGSEIKKAVTDFLAAAHGKGLQEVELDSGLTLSAGGGANLVCYVGHDGLMDFALSEKFVKENSGQRDAIILACLSKSYFAPYLKGSGAGPLLWTTGLMAPEAYTLEAALEGWAAGEKPEEIRDRAAKAYAKYQKCGLGAAKRLLVTGW